MPETFKRLGSGAVCTAELTMYTVPGSTTAIVKLIEIVNVVGVTARITVKHGIIRIQKEVPVDTNGSLEFDGTLCMAAADILTFQSDVLSAFEVSIYGIEIS